MEVREYNGARSQARDQPAQIERRQQSAGLWPRDHDRDAGDQRREDRRCTRKKNDLTHRQIEGGFASEAALVMQELGIDSAAGPGCPSVRGASLDARVVFGGWQIRRPSRIVDLAAASFECGLPAR
jgi:hypothetical protein